MVKFVIDCVLNIQTQHKFNFLLVKIKQSDWLRSLSERAGFLYSARSEMQLPTVKCNCPLRFSRQNQGVKQF
jgi:hypothetical protein